MKFIKYLSIILLILAIPITVFFSQQQQKTQQHAATNGTTITSLQYFTGGFSIDDVNKVVNNGIKIDITGK